MNYQQEEMNESLLSSLKQAWNDFDSIVEKLTLALIHYFFTLSIMKSHLIQTVSIHNINKIYREGSHVVLHAFASVTARTSTGT
jgi:hypothetical protein